MLLDVSILDITFVILLVYILIKNITFYRSVKNLSTAEKLLKLVEKVTHFKFDIRLRAWDGSETGPKGASVLHFKSKSVVRWLIWSPRFPSLGIVRALADGNDLGIDGDLNDFCQRVNISGLVLLECYFPSYIRFVLTSLKTLLVVVSIFGWSLLCLPPTIPLQEFKSKSTKKHTSNMNKEICDFAYSFNNKFFELMLGPTMVFSCAYYETPDMSLDEAQLAKLEMACRKLGLKKGMTVLDIGCGWGSFLIHAAQKYGVTAKGITLSLDQYKYAQEKIKRLGLEKLVDVQLMDFRDLNEVGHYDAIVSIEMIEHIGIKNHRRFVQLMHKLLKPGGKLVLQTSSLGFVQAEYEKFLTTQILQHPAFEQYFFPSCEMVYVHASIKLLDEAGLEVRTVENLREHFVMTCKDFLKNLEENEEELLKDMSPGFLKCYKLMLACSAHGCRNGFGSNIQILSIKANQEASDA